METFITIATLFVLGSLIGWVIEVLFRRFFSAHKWINPGFMVGPYIPLYGFGVVILYLLSNLDFSVIGLDELSPWTIILKILFIAFSLIFIEFIAGLIFIKGLKIKLWDYSNQKFNIMGIICPLFSFFWLVIACVYYFFINPYLVDFISYLAKDPTHFYYFFIGIVIGMMIVDFAYSMHIATIIRKAAKELKIVINLDKFKEFVKSKTHELYFKDSNLKYHTPFFFPFKYSRVSMQEKVKKYIEELENKIKSITDKDINNNDNK